MGYTPLTMLSATLASPSATVKKRRQANPTPPQQKAVKARRKPAWLVPVVVLLVGIAVVALALIASRSKS